jgi:hypothetical protein
MDMQHLVVYEQGSALCIKARTTLSALFTLRNICDSINSRSGGNAHNNSLHLTAFPVRPDALHTADLEIGALPACPTPAPAAFLSAVGDQVPADLRMVQLLSNLLRVDQVGWQQHCDCKNKTSMFQHCNVFS